LAKRGRERLIFGMAWMLVNIVGLYT
jgi:hypothetical protein